MAHELGEREAAVVFRALAIDPRIARRRRRPMGGEPTRESHSVADGAGWPRRAGLQLGPNAIKEQFSTASHELIARRILEFSEPPVVITIFDHGKLSFRQGNRGGRLALTPLERQCWRSVHVSVAPPRSVPRPDVPSAAGPSTSRNRKRELLRLDLLDEPEVWCSDEPALCEE